MPARHDGILGNEYRDESKPGARPIAHVSATKWVINLLRPSFLNRSGALHEQAGHTAYLDGLRGFAAFIVYWHHHQLWAHDAISANAILESGFGYNGQYHFACLHGIRTFFTGGHYAVAVFFVISGYVLSAKPLKLIHAGEYLKLGDNLASALFRRWLRLYIPIICTSFLFMTSWHAPGLWTDQVHQSNYYDELYRWYCELKNFSFVYNTSGNPWFPYNSHLWSIPVEFRGSIVIYTSLLAFSRCTRNARLWCEVGLIVYFLYIADGWFCSMFAAGMLICDLDLLAASNDLPRFFSRIKPFKELVFYTFLVISIYLGGVPSNSSELQELKSTAGWYYLSFLKPQAVFDYKWFYLFWAATFLVVSTSRISWLKNFFEAPFNQYLGRISYSLYLVHGPVLWILSDRLYVATGWSRDVHMNGLPNWINILPLSKGGPLGLELSFLIPHLVILPVTLWLAEIVTKLIDKPSVKFAQRVYGMALTPSAIL